MLLKIKGALLNMTINDKPWQLHSECTTKATEPDGTRHSCTSEQPDILESPDGWVIDDRSHEDYIDKNGSENDVKLSFENYIRPFPNIPEIEFPTKVTLSVSARSPGGHSSGRGWTKATIKGRMFSYRELIQEISETLNHNNNNNNN